MFIQAFENLQKATEASVAMQQELFKKWFSLWPGVPTFPGGNAEQMAQFQKRWTETIGELVRRQREVTETQFKAGMENIEKAFQLGQAKNPAELRAKTIELWQKCFDTMRQAAEAQIRETQVATQKWFELMTTAFPSS